MPDSKWHFKLTFSVLLLKKNCHYVLENPLENIFPLNNAIHLNKNSLRNFREIIPQGL